MESRYYLLSFSVSGIKNIEKEITLDFYNKTIDKAFNPEKFKVKAIYGENGSGKTAIVTAARILKNLIISEDYFGDKDIQKKLQKLVNKKTKKLDISSIFLARGKDRQGSIVYKYTIEIALNPAGKFELAREELSRKSGDYTSSKYKVVYKCENNLITDISLGEDSEKEFTSLAINRLGKTSFAFIALNGIRVVGLQPDNSEFHVAIYDTSLFAFNTYVSIEESDKHDAYLYSEELKNAKTSDEYVEAYSRFRSQMDLMIQDGRKTIPKKRYKSYVEEIKRLTAFVKLFKQDLVSIDIDKRENSDMYETSLLMNYGDYSVDLEFESTGIKRIIKMFNYMCCAVSGSIVFIDEMDSNINDVYLTKLVEFFLLYGEGQLCFTTHNTSPMAALRRNKKSIDFISNDNRIVSWTTNGNFAPDKLYKQGMIEYLPFNIEAEDFLGILEE